MQKNTHTFIVQILWTFEYIEQKKRKKEREKIEHTHSHNGGEHQSKPIINIIHILLYIVKINYYESTNEQISVHVLFSFLPFCQAQPYFRWMKPMDVKCRVKYISFILPY